MKVAILSYGTVVYDSNGEFKQSFPTEEAVEYIREQELMKKRFDQNGKELSKGELANQCEWIKNSRFKDGS
jgi:hypothetical protein